MKVQFKQRKLSIKIRITNGRGNLDIIRTLPYKLTPINTWNSKLPLTDDNLPLNMKIIELKFLILSTVNNAILKNELIDKKFVLDLSNGFINPQILVNKSPLLIDYIDVSKKKCLPLYFPFKK